MKTMIATIKKDFDFKDNRVRYTFFSAIIAGFLAHGFMISNKLSWHDDIGIIFNEQGSPLGRWFLAILTKLYAKLFGSNASVSWFIGLTVLVMLAIGAVLVTVIFELDNRADYIIIGSVMAVFPSVTSLFGYMWVATYDTISILLSIVAVYVLLRAKTPAWRIIFGSVILCLSMGIYQAFINVTVFLLVILFIKNIMVDPQRNIKIIMIDIGVYGATLILGLLEYLVVNKFFLKVQNIRMISYQGLSEMDKISLRQLKEGIIASYHDFFVPIQHDGETMFMDNMRIVYYILLGIIIVFGIISFVKIFMKKKLNAVLLAVAMLCVPLAYNFVHLLGASYVYGLMVYAKCMLILLCLVMLRYTDVSLLFVKKAMKNFSVLCCIFIVWFYIDFANKCYLKAKFQQEETQAWMTTFSTQIKSVDGYDDELPIAYINDREKADKSSFEVSPISGIYLPPYNLGGLNNNYQWKTYMKYWCGFYQLEVEDYTPYENNAVIEAMPSYPDDGSIRVIDDVIVVKF